jgi:N-methylhydantoinase A/oxoprolinase/acetone carboxylase beta subunit
VVKLISDFYVLKAQLMARRRKIKMVEKRARRVRIGIDVGGTFTKGVVLDCETYEIIGKATVLTTHDAPEGVARGVIQVFRKMLMDLDIDPADVVFLAHSTTQATNALLEGDVAPVGIVGMGKGVEGLIAKSDTNIGRIELAQGKYLDTYHCFISSSEVSENTVKNAIEQLVTKGAKAIVASETWSVDNPTNELLVIELAGKMGLPATGGHEVTKLYGLHGRTVTAAVNASILPKMMETANMVESSVARAGITAPVMIMRGDGGVMDINEVKRRPILTMLSGPAASVAGALMYLRVFDGIFFEVGGTSTNIGVIKRGRPTLKYVKVGAHNTYVNSLDVRVIGVAGGSMVRIKGNQIIDVGPRSAHIAGFPYEAFANTEEITDPQVVFVQPKPKDPQDYVAVKTTSGKMFAITTTGAANVLGLTKPGDYAHGNPEASRRAIEPLARMLGLTVEETCTRILDAASRKVIGIIKDLLQEYELDKGQTLLVGGGGGAAALIPFIAKKLDMQYKISENAEVISSIGVSLAMVCEVVERTVPNPRPEDLLSIGNEARAAAIRSGAVPETIDIFISVDSKRHIVRALARGATEIRTQDLSKRVSLNEARTIIAEALSLDPGDVKLVAETKTMYIFSGEKKEKALLFFKTKKNFIGVIDRCGSVRLKCSNVKSLSSCVKRAMDDLKSFWLEITCGGGITGTTGELFVIVGDRIIDLSDLELWNWNQIAAIMETELGRWQPDEPVFIVGKAQLPVG